MQRATIFRYLASDRATAVQNVTLGGTGKDVGDRHPKVGNHVLIGCGASILGNITIGVGAQIAAGSLVLKPVAPHTLVAGSPAQYVRDVVGNPAALLQQWLQSEGEASSSGSEEAASASGSSGSDSTATQSRVTVTGLEVPRYQRKAGRRQLAAEADLFSSRSGAHSEAQRCEPAAQQPQHEQRVHNGVASSSDGEYSAWHSSIPDPSGAASDHSQEGSHTSEPQRKEHSSAAGRRRSVMAHIAAPDPITDRVARLQEQQRALESAVYSARSHESSLQFAHSPEADSTDECDSAVDRLKYDDEEEAHEGDVLRVGAAVNATMSDAEAEKLWGRGYAEPEWSI